MKPDSANKLPDLENLLAEMPAEPSASFTDRVLADYAIETMLREMPVVPDENFVETTLDKSQAPRRRFPGIVFLSRAVAAGIAVAATAVFLFKNETAIRAELALASRVEQAVKSDPELSLLAQTDDESPSFDDLLFASEILSTIDPSVLEIFAYND